MTEDEMAEARIAWKTLKEFEQTRQLGGMTYSGTDYEAKWHELAASCLRYFPALLGRVRALRGELEEAGE